MHNFEEVKQFWMLILYSRKFLEGLISGNFQNLVHFLKINFQKLFSTMYKYLKKISAESEYNRSMKDCLP